MIDANTVFLAKATLAAHAPEEVPMWFSFPRPTYPPQPISWEDAKVINEVDRKELRAFIYDPIFDLPEEYAWFQEAWSKYWGEKRRIDDQYFQDRHFAWRAYYAERVTSELLRRTPFNELQQAAS